MMFTPSQIIKGGLEIVSGVKKLSRDRDMGKTQADRDRLCRALRSIYFTPKGVVSLLDKLLKGEKPTPKEVREILVQFNDAEWSVERDLQFLLFDTQFDSLSVSLSTAKQLDQIRWGKIGVRRAIQESINHYGQPRKKIDLELIGKVKKDVKKLNALIEKVEQQLNSRAK